MLFSIDGTYDEAFDLCMAVCERFGFYNRNTAVNAFLGEGKKTIALEIWEQLGFRAPDVVVVPVGDGCIIGGVFKGFRDLLDLGLIPRLPRLIGVQATGSAALATAWEKGQALCQPVQASTVADSIAVASPRDQVKALRAVRESGGCIVSVTDEAILEALALLARHAGILVEPAAATPLAALKLAGASRCADLGDEVVLLLTGHGLKDIPAVARATAGREPPVLKPELSAIERALKGYDPDV
jgi:threonine synthase